MSDVAQLGFATLIISDSEQRFCVHLACRGLPIVLFFPPTGAPRSESNVAGGSVRMFRSFDRLEIPRKWPENVPTSSLACLQAYTAPLPAGEDGPRERA